MGVALLLTTVTAATLLMVGEAEAGTCTTGDVDIMPNAISSVGGSKEKRRQLAMELDACPTNAGTMVQLAQIYEVDGDLDKAEELYNQVLLDGKDYFELNHVVAMGGLAAIMEKRNRHKDAREAYESLLDKLHSDKLKSVEGVGNLEKYFENRMEDVRVVIKKNETEPVLSLMHSLKPPPKTVGIEFMQETEHKSKAGYAGTDKKQSIGEEYKNKSPYAGN